LGRAQDCPRQIVRGVAGRRCAGEGVFSGVHGSVRHATASSIPLRFAANVRHRPNPRRTACGVDRSAAGEPTSAPFWWGDRRPPTEVHRLAEGAGRSAAWAGSAASRQQAGTPDAGTVEPNSCQAWPASTWVVRPSCLRWRIGRGHRGTGNLRYRRGSERLRPDFGGSPT